jgi:ABC-2 type transport system permease protein
LKALLTAIAGGFLAEISHLTRSRLFVALTVIQAVTFLFLVSLFGLTGSYAPTAIIAEDQGPYAHMLITQLTEAHHSFALRQMDPAAAQAALHKGDLVAIITIPKNFSYALAHGENTDVNVAVDNVNTDMTDDIQRALPAAIVALGKQLHLPGIHVQVAEHDLIDHDTGFIPYLVVSGLALDAFVIASILSAMAVAREFEAGTVKLLAMAPLHPLIPIVGRVLATDLVASVAMVLPVLLAVFAYRVVPIHPLEMVGVILLCTTIFSCIGVALGALLKRTLPVASFVFGISLPLYIGSNALEPQRFDGYLIWLLAHASPVYYAVGILEQAFHGLQVTPESVSTNFLALVGWAVVMLFLAGMLLRTATVEKTVVPSGEKERVKGQRQRQSLAAGKLWWQEQRSILANNWLPLLLCILFLIGSESWFTAQQSANVNMQSQQPQPALATTADQQQNNQIWNDIDTIDSLVNDPDGGNASIKKANVLTLEALRQVDPSSKAVLMNYLDTSGLISVASPVISLQGADLEGAQLAGLDLRNTDLRGVNFHASNLRGSNLSGANLAGANLAGANLSSASLAGANLSGTNLHNANVSNANLTEAYMKDAVGISAFQMERANSLAGATLPDGSTLPEPNDSDG